MREFSTKLEAFGILKSLAWWSAHRESGLADVHVVVGRAFKPALVILNGRCVVGTIPGRCGEQTPLACGPWLSCIAVTNS